MNTLTKTVTTANKININRSKTMATSRHSTCRRSLASADLFLSRRSLRYCKIFFSIITCAEGIWLAVGFCVEGRLIGT